MTPTGAAQKVSWNWFLLLVLWGGIMGLGTTAIFVLDSWHDYAGDPINWKMVWHMGGYGFALGCIGKWRAYKAYLQLPPGFEQLVAINSMAKTVNAAGDVTSRIESKTVVTLPKDPSQ